jgi:DNA-nicking Smr family endonuclease
MAARKLPPDRGLKRSKASLREQLEALPAMIPPMIPPMPKAPADAPVPRSADQVRPQIKNPTSRAHPLELSSAQSSKHSFNDLSFKDLARDVRPLPEPSRPVLPQAPTPPLTQAVAPKTRLWVDRRGGAVRAMADGLPPRLLDELRSGKVVPRRQLDLHRRSVIEARQVLDDGVRGARRDGVTCLLVVCGRGVHSGADGPVLPEVVVERLSEELADEILAFCTAPRKWGGEGALIVRLRAPPDAPGVGVERRS